VYSKSLLEDYERFAYKQMHSRWNHTKKGTIIKFARLEYEHNISAAKKLDIKNIPEIHIIRDGKVICRHSDRKYTMRKIKKFINACYFDSLFVRLYQDAMNILNVTKLSIIWYGERNHKKARGLAHWTMTHYKDREGLMFYFIQDKQIGKDLLGLEWNTMAMYRKSDKKTIPYKEHMFSHRM